LTEHPAHQIVINHLYEIKVIYRLKRVLGGNIGKMVRYSKKILDQVLRTEASAKELRRMDYCKNQVDMWNHDEQNYYNQSMRHRKCWFNTNIFRRFLKSSPDWEPSLFMIFEAEKANELAPQAGLETMNTVYVLLDMIINQLNIKCSDDIIKEIEGLVLLFMTVSNTRNAIGALSAIGLYIRQRFDTSLSREIMKYIGDIMEMTTQSGFEDLKDDTDEDPIWLKFMKDVKMNWVQCQKSVLFKNFTRVLSVVVLSGLYRVADLTFSIAGYKVVEPDMRLLMSGAGDLMTAVVDIVIYFAERIYYAYKTGSFKPFMVDSLETAELEVEYTNIMNQWELYRNGNLEKIANISPHAFLDSLYNMRIKLESMLATAKNLDKRILETKYREIIKTLGDFQMIRGNSSFRRSPFAIEYYGLSSVGKSTLSEQTTHYLFSSAGLDTSDLKKYTYISGKKHWDGARSDMLELKVDDHANVKSDFVETSPCDVIIKVCNNVPFSPPMADIINKGKVFVEPELVTLTTNVESLDAGTYSNNPFSIQRRMHIIVEVEVKKEFIKTTGGKPSGVDTSKVMASQTVDGVYSPPPYHDIWELTVKKAVPVDKPSCVGGYVVVEHNGKKLSKISMKEWLNYATDMFHKHREQQFNLEKTQAQSTRCEICDVDGCKQLKGFCLVHNHGPQFGFETMRNVCTQSTASLLAEGREFYDTYDWLPYLPDGVFDNKLVRMLATFYNARNLMQVYSRYTKYNIILAVASALMVHFYGSSSLPLFLLVFTFCSYIQFAMIHRIRDAYIERLRDRQVLNEIHRTWRNRFAQVIMTSSVVVGSIYAASKLYRRLYGVECQGNLEPNDPLDIEQRDAEKNIWAPVVKRPLPCTQKSKEHTQAVVMIKVAKNLLYATIEGDDDHKRMGNVLFLDSNVLVIPDHYFTLSNSDSLKLTCYKENAGSIGGSFVTRVDKCASVHIENTDLRVCYSSSGGSYGNILCYFPTGKIIDHAFKMMWRAKSGDLHMFNGLGKVKKTSNGIASFEGGEYANFQGNTFNGMCGAVLISENKQTCITGIHLGGKEGTPRGCFGTVTKETLEDAIDKIMESPGVVKTGTMGDFEPQVLGVKLMTDEPLHPKSPVNFLPKDSQFMYYGSCIGATSSRSDVRTTPISQFIENVTGVQNIWGKPKMKPEWEGWQKAMANASHPAEPVKHELLVKSVVDYREPLLDLAREYPWCFETPLNDHENLCGRDGCKFIDAIQLNTAIGFPLVGPKRKYVTELEPTKDKPNNRILDAEIMQYINECEDKYRKGYRNHFVAKACKKDEVLPVAKGKCRIFYANPIAMTWLVRKYYLPIIRMLQMNPLISECAVGINCHGPEWNQFYEFVTKHGDERLIGGDYGKYDQKLPSQKLIASLSILIDIAREMDYTDEHISIMQAMVGDIVYAMIAYNGDLLGTQSGTHISGNSLTVILNGISGSLNLRDYFYTQYDRRVSFRDAVSLMTYGDDNIGSVKKGFDKFTIKGAAEFLGAHGQIYTMPDKESELRAYLNPTDFEFLKRFNVYHPKLGCNVGALLDTSIFKSLHCYMRPKDAPLTPSEACAQNIDTALREWFNHGEEVYEMRREQMRQVASLSDLSHMCTLLTMSYDDMADHWKYKYADGPEPIVENDTFSIS